MTPSTTPSEGEATPKTLRRKLGEVDIDHAWLVETFSYDPETGIFVKRGRWSQEKSGTTSYRNIRLLPGRFFRTHRVIWFYVHGRWPLYIDHVNGNRSDNRLSNLREATPSRNTVAGDSKPVGKHGYRGVRQTRGSISGGYFAEIRVTPNRFKSDTFGSAEDAAREYDRLALLNFGDFAVLNFPGANNDG